MFAIVPVHNEKDRLRQSLSNLFRAEGVKKVIIIANGCDAATRHQVRNLDRENVAVLEYPLPLGLDVPRALGAAIALAQGAKHVLFYDGDMVGNFTGELNQLLCTAKNCGLDITLTDCYPQPPSPRSTAELMLNFRRKLTILLGLDNDIGAASPSHGPHIVSRRLLQTIPLMELAIPPVAMARAVPAGLKVGIGAVIPHYRLGSTIRDSSHTAPLVETVIGDHIEAMQAYLQVPRTRSYGQKIYCGYNDRRRFDLLQELLARNSWRQYLTNR